MKTKILLCAIVIALPSFAAKYKIDTTHSSIEFKIKHLMISNVRGAFNDFSGTLEFNDKKPKNFEADAIIEAASIDTNNEKRDAHLKSKDFFEVEKYPKLKFDSLKVKEYKNGKGVLTGNLTMHGVTNKVELDFAFVGKNKIWGKNKIAFTATGKLNRTDYGLKWNDTLETGGVLVGEEVEIILDIQADEITETK